MNSAPPTSACILIVDDQEQNLQLVGTVLSMTGYEILSAQSGEQAFQQLEEHTPDLILLDLMMPGVDGIEVCRQLKADPQWADLPVIFLSAADDKNLIVEALECGGVDYVTKPFNKAELVTRVRTHLALKQARDQLRDLAEDKDELLGILTHDLGNHLAGIQMSAGVLLRQDGAIPSKSTVLVENIAQSTECMLGFVKEFLANQSAEHLQVNPEVLDINAVICETASIHAVMASAKNISLELDLPNGAIPALADPKALRQVMDNLLSNALKFSPNDRAVKLSAEKMPLGWVQITVKDQGPGFTEDDQQRMFRRYGRLSARPTGGEPSTGLGLSIVKRLVDAMNGRVMLESEAGKGATFSVRLPAASGE